MKKSYLWISLIIILLGIFIYINPNQVITKTILKITGDYAAPEYETAESILSKVKAKDLYFDRLYMVKDYPSFVELQKKKLTTFPFVQIYNRDKKLLRIASGNECTWALMNFFSQHDSLHLVAGDSLMYKYITDRLAPVLLKTEADTFKYYVLAGWVNFLPKFTNRLFEQTNQMHLTIKDNVCFSYISFDFQKDWEAFME